MDRPSRVEQKDLGIAPGFIWRRLFVDPVGGFVVAGFRGNDLAHHGAFWVRRFDEVHYRPLCGTVPALENHASCAFDFAGGILDVNVMVLQQDDAAGPQNSGWD